MSTHSSRISRADRSGSRWWAPRRASWWIGVLFAIEPHRLDWWSSGVQLVGTLLFNVSTWNALQASLSTTEVHRRVRAPDAFGSICFLVASYLAYLEVCGAPACRPAALAVALDRGGEPPWLGRIRRLRHVVLRAARDRQRAGRQDRERRHRRTARSASSPQR